MKCRTVVRAVSLKVKSLLCLLDQSSAGDTASVLLIRRLEKCSEVVQVCHYVACSTCQSIMGCRKEVQLYLPHTHSGEGRVKASAVVDLKWEARSLAQVALQGCLQTTEHHAPSEAARHCDILPIPVEGTASDASGET